MPKILLLSIFLIIPSVWKAQSIDFVRQNGHSAIRYIYGDDSSKPQPSSYAQGGCCIDTTHYPVPLRITAQVYNTGIQTAHDVWFKATFVDSNYTVYDSIYSDTLSLNSGDTLLLTTHDFTPAFSGKFLLSLYQQSQQIDIDSIRFAYSGINYGKLSYTFGSVDNHISTNDFGYDDLAFAQLFLGAGEMHLTGINIVHGSNTVPGGVFQIEIFDSSQFNINSGFSGTPLLSYLISVTPPSLFNRNGYSHHPISGLIFKGSTSKKYYYIVFRFFSNAGANEITIGNSRAYSQPDDVLFFHNAKTGKWQDVNDTSDIIVSPMIETVFFLPHGDPAGPFFEEIDLVEVELFPNPADQYLEIELPEYTFNQLRVEFLDPAGKLVKEVSFSPDEKIYTGDMAEGNYFLMIFDKKKLINNSKLTIRHK